MAWTAPRTWVTGEMTTAALLNLYMRDNQTMLGSHPHTGSAGDGVNNMKIISGTFNSTAGKAPSGSPNVVFYGSNDLGHWRDATGTHSIAILGHVHGG